MRNRFAHVAFAVLAAAVLVFVLMRRDSPVAEPESTGTSTMVEADLTPEPTTRASSSATAAVSVEDQVDSAAITTTPAPRYEVLSPEASAYTEGLLDVKMTLHTLVVRISAANSDWDNREETDARYTEIEAELVDVRQGLALLEQVLQDQVVPPILQDRHLGVDGPVQHAGVLVGLAGAVLDGLRLPAPDDGSTRRAALSDFVNAADVLNRSVDDLIRHLEENASELGLTIMVSATTISAQPEQDTPEEATTTTQPARQLSMEASSYITGLTGFKETLAELVESGNATNLAWDNADETRVTYGATESALIEIQDRIKMFRSAVAAHLPPDPLAARGRRIVGLAADLVPPAEAVLDGLRLPAPEDGSARRAALADLNAAAADFGAAVDDLVGYIDENAESLGLLDDA